VGVGRRLVNQRRKKNGQRGKEGGKRERVVSGGWGLGGRRVEHEKEGKKGSLGDQNPQPAVARGLGKKLYWG